MIMAAAAAATKTADDDDWYATVKYKKLRMQLSNSLVHNAVHSNFFKSLQLSCLFCAKSIISSNHYNFLVYFVQNQ